MMGERRDWMQRPDEYEALLVGDEVHTIGGMVIGHVVRATRYKNNAGYMLICLRVRGTNGVIYHARLAAGKTLVKLRRVKPA